VLHGDELDHLHHLICGEMELAPQHIPHDVVQGVRHPGLLLPHETQTRQRELDGGFRWGILQSLLGRTNYSVYLFRPDVYFTGQLTADLRQNVRDQIRLRQG